MHRTPDPVVAIAGAETAFLPTSQAMRSVAALSIAFYFTIIGVLEMGVATASLLAFVALSLWIWRPRAQVRGVSRDA